MKRRLLWLLLLAAVSGFWLWLRPEAATAQDEDETLLRVGVSHHPPLAIRFDDGWDGIAVDLWQRAANDLGVQYEWVELAASEEAEAVQGGLVDVAITTVATAESEQTLDFSHTYFASSLGYVESQERQLFEIVHGVLTPGFWRTAAWVVLILLVVGALTWLFERRQNPDDFGGGWLRGLWSGFWFAAVTLTAVGYGDKTPRTVLGRVVALFWMVMALGIAATLTAAIISAVALRDNGGFSFPEDLRGVAVGTRASSLSAGYLEGQGIDFQGYPSTEDGLRAVRAGEVRVFVDEAAALRYYNDALFDGGLPVVVAPAGVQRYAFALPDDDPLVEPINEAILRHVNGDSWPDLLRRFGAVNGP